MQTEKSIDVSELRKALGWSQYKLADYLGCDQSTVSRIEAGAQPSGPMLRLLALLHGDVASKSQAAPPKDVPGRPARLAKSPSTLSQAAAR